MRAEQITGAETVHGEGAVWWPEQQALLWVDMLAGDVLRLDRAAEVERWRVEPGDSVAAVVRPRSAGGLVVAGERVVRLCPAYGEVADVVVHVVHDPDLRLNEGGCDPDGRFWCGTTSWTERTGTGTLFRVDRDLVVHAVLDGISVSNGLAWSADGSRSVYVDSVTSRVDESDADLVRRRPLVRVDRGTGVPDGVCLDAEGGLWVALWQGGAVHRYDMFGRLTQIVELPVGQVTSCTFGGDALSDLFVTTSRLGLADPEPGAGALFRVSTGMTGVPTRAFAA